MPSKSIFRKPEAQHFQLVHRSLRDPLIHDPEASQHVLKQFERPNERKGKSRADLERVLTDDSTRPNVGEAAEYGIYYDDTEYDYMQHLRPVGLREDGVDSVLIEAPSSSKVKAKSKDPISIIDIPSEALPSTSEMPRTYESQQAIPSSISGFQPDMDPHLRQVLEALEDDEFVEDDLQDNFFGELVSGGERKTDEEIEFSFAEEGLNEDTSEAIADDDTGEEEGWEAQFARFQKAQKAAASSSHSDIDGHSDDGDTVGSLPQFSVLGGKKRRKAGSDASGYSMSSSSMFRNEGLTTLDERFDQLQKEYDSEEEQQEDDSDTDSAPELITSREDFDAMMNEFLDKYEIVGGKMRAVLPGETAVDKLDTIRKALGEAKIRDVDEDSEDDDILMPVDIDEEKDRWDCETILTTYSNLENHPRLIRARHITATPRIRLDPRTGMPAVGEATPRTKHAGLLKEEDGDIERRKYVEFPNDPRFNVHALAAAHVTISRPKDESKEDKKSRKHAVKAERHARRVDKKAMKEQFTSEIKQQSKRLSDKEKTKVRKL
ncbi:LTV-domain-containing protein [Trametopsis cervina]|nr:LTV-domain-containing protein [Trametopsis cervina]